MLQLKNFFFLEGAYLILGAIILLITLFVGTRSFMSKGAWKRGLLWVSLVIAIVIGSHYYVTTKRMAEVQRVFHEGGTILCESRMIRKGARFVTISKDNAWTLENDNFMSPNYVRPFFAARCIVE